MEKSWFVSKVCKGMVLAILLLYFSECDETVKNKNIMPVKKSIKGILIDQQGKPVFDAVITVAGSAQSLPDIASSTDEKGQFFIDNLQLPGSYTILINYMGESTSKVISLREADSVFTVQL
ncbi:MAG: carboxypeptidase-like regulatory domain-containing protein [Chitinophagaceae bacterium]